MRNTTTQHGKHAFKTGRKFPFVWLNLLDNNSASDLSPIIPSSTKLKMKPREKEASLLITSFISCRPAQTTSPLFLRGRLFILSQSPFSHNPRPPNLLHSHFVTTVAWSRMEFLDWIKPENKTTRILIQNRMRTRQEVWVERGHAPRNYLSFPIPQLLARSSGTRLLFCVWQIFYGKETEKNRDWIIIIVVVVVIIIVTIFFIVVFSKEKTEEEGW